MDRAHGAAVHGGMIRYSMVHGYGVAVGLSNSSPTAPPKTAKAAVVVFRFLFSTGRRV